MHERANIHFPRSGVIHAKLIIKPYPQGWEPSGLAGSTVVCKSWNQGQCMSPIASRTDALRARSLTALWPVPASPQNVATEREKVFPYH